MRRTIAGLTTTGLLLTALGGCSGGGRSRGMQSTPSPSAGARLSHPHPAYTAADVRFMSDMIRHHAQALLIAGWIPSHGANETLRRLGERIVVGQQDEKALMERWLQDRNEAVPGPDPSHAMKPGTAHSATGHSASMPGMLTAEQLTRLDRARGREFDRLFLKFMIIHHQGAVVMVDQLMDAPGAAQDDTVFRLASDIQAEQSSEINRMQQMLDALPPEAPAP
jgi:uncharacterized protein (DUF305 family)